MFKVLLVYVFCFFTYTLHSQVSIDVYTDTQKFYNYYVTKQTLDFSCGNIKGKESLFQCDYTRVRSYYFNNVLKEEYSFKKEGFIIGEYRSYYANGQLSTFYTCEGGNKVDFYLEFYDNGKKK